MKYSKGLSQTLSLIVGASVLMMTALSLVFVVQGGLTDTSQGSQSNSCMSTVRSNCEIKSASGSSAKINVPSSCITDDGTDDGDSSDKIVDALQDADSSSTLNPTKKISCSEINY